MTLYGGSFIEHQLKVLKVAVKDSLEQGCKWDVWSRDRDVRVSRPRRWSDGIETRPRRQCHQSEMRPRRDDVSRRSVETFKPWLVIIQLQLC